MYELEPTSKQSEFESITNGFFQYFAIMLKLTQFLKIGKGFISL